MSGRSSEMILWDFIQPSVRPNHNNVTIERSGVIQLLVNLLKSGGFRGNKDASTTLYSLCSMKEKRIRAIQS
ncbi:hypothetical protein GBA52_008129 [Prunus armeniaca]|nr:hypothetical protein GBA52_008129 [Prunus armeniaca]